MEGPKAEEALRCAGCLNDIGKDEYVSAGGQGWHKDCFRCSVCDCQLSTWYFEKAGLLFCQADYWERFGENCHQCAQVITGPVMCAGSHGFHPECFWCARCGAPLEHGDQYALVDTTTLYCECCYAETAGGGDGHAIRVVDVPAAAIRLAAHKGAIQVTQMDSSCGVLSLHIGDRVLEINGAPVTAARLADIRRELARAGPDTRLQLTIEHNPETTNPPTTDNKNIPTTKDSETQQSTYDTKSPVERKILKEDLKKQNIPEHSEKETEIGDSGGKKERLFKRKGDEGSKARVLKRRQTPAANLLDPAAALQPHKERSSSMSKLLDVVDGSECSGVLCELSRARSFRVEPAAHPHQVFRAADLVQGELLGCGFFGEVYKVTHRATGEVMVLKQLYRVDEDAQRNFLKEVAVLRSLAHPNVLRFIGVLYRDKRLHLVTEYVAGGTLHQLLQDTSIELSWRVRASVARDVARGVGYLHRRNVIHRDLNSHNCLVREDLTVIVADFGLARIVQRTASSAHGRANANTNTLRRKRYTVVGNPYWMAPEMMNGKVYDEKVDVFSFGIILCEIIGRVSADPDYLPRRSDFGLHEAAFLELFCRNTPCPEPFYRIAFQACHLDPDKRPSFEVIEIWLESLVMHLSNPSPLPPNLLADILQYSQGRRSEGHATPECCHHNSTNSYDTGQCCQLSNSIFYANKTEQCCLSKQCGSCEKLKRSPSKVASGGSVEVNLNEDGVVKSQSNASLEPSRRSFQNIIPSLKLTIPLGKCVSASQVGTPKAAPAKMLSRSTHGLHTAAGYILRNCGDTIDITKVDDITEWLEPPLPLKRTNPADNLSADTKSRKVDNDPPHNLPSFLRNQSVEGLETEYKHEVDAPIPICRHISIPDHCHIQRQVNRVQQLQNDSDSSDSDDNDMCAWYKNVSTFKKIEKMEVDQPKNILGSIVKKGENLLSKKSSYDVADVTLKNADSVVTLRNTDSVNERKVADVDCRRFNIDYLTKNPVMAAGIKNIQKTVEVQKPVEKSSFFSKKLLSPKLSRLFKPNTCQVVRNKQVSDENKDEKSHSKSPSNLCRTSHRVRPLDDAKKPESNVLKSDLKLASMGKPMTPIFRRHLPSDKTDFADGRFSYRDKRTKYEFKEPKFVDVGRNRIKTPITSVEKSNLAPLIRSTQTNNIPALSTVPEKKLNDKNNERSKFDNQSYLDAPKQTDRPNKLPIDIKTDNTKKSDDLKTMENVKKREPGISRSNYVSLANLRINSKKDGEVIDESNSNLNDNPPVERVN